MCSGTQMHVAHRLYTRLGFVRLPERDWQPAPGVHLLAFGTTGRTHRNDLDAVRGVDFEVQLGELGHGRVSTW